MNFERIESVKGEEKSKQVNFFVFFGGWLIFYLNYPQIQKLEIYIQEECYYLIIEMKCFALHICTTDLLYNGCLNILALNFVGSKY